MTGQSTGRIIGFAALGLFCALAAWIWVPGPAAPVPATQTPARDVTARIVSGQDRLADLIAVTTERPLFDATRRPVAAPEAPAPAAPPEPVLTLVGILGLEEDRVALVRISTSAQLYQLTAGATLGAWEIIDVTSNAVTIRKGDGPQEQLFIDR